MPYTEFPWPGFAGGLNLRDQPDAVGAEQAVDLFDVTFTERGAVKQRDGTAQFTAVAGPARYDSLSAYYTSGGDRRLVAGCGNRLEVLSTAGAVLASTTAPTANPHFFARFGGPAAESVFCANGADTLRRLDGTTFTTPSFTGPLPTGMFVAVAPWDNRLALARFQGAAGNTNPSTVRFSNPGDPLTWGTNNYIQITPGDGEAITGMAVFRGQLFVFKETKFAVVNDTTTDASGNPIFNYRVYDTGVGLIAPRAVAASQNGLFFMSRTGVWRSKGGPAQQVSQAIDPVFAGNPNSFYTSGVLNHAQIAKAAMGALQGRVFLAIPTGVETSNTLMAVLDAEQGWWALYGIAAAALTAFRAGDRDELLYAHASGANHLGRHGPAHTTDNGTAIASRWRSGWLDGGSDRHKTIRQLRAWGRGKVYVALAANFRAPQPPTLVDFQAGVDTWGTGGPADLWGDGSPGDTWGSGAVQTGRLVRNSIRGSVFSLSLSAHQGEAWTIGRLTAHFRGQRVPAVTHTES